MTRYPRSRISAVLFQYRKEHQYPIRGHILKPITCVEPSPGLSGNVLQMISLTSKNSGASLTPKWWLLYVYRYTCFQFTRRFAGTQPLCVMRFTCVKNTVIILPPFQNTKGEDNFCHLFCTVVNRCLLLWGKNINYKCWKARSPGNSCTWKRWNQCGLEAVKWRGTSWFMQLT
jgi:hypothetical protein